MNWRKSGNGLRVIYGKVCLKGLRDGTKIPQSPSVYWPGSSSAPLTYCTSQELKVIPRRKLERDYVATPPPARIDTFLHALKMLTLSDCGTCDFFFCIMFLQWLVTAFTSPFLAAPLSLSLITHIAAHLFGSDSRSGP